MATTKSIKESIRDVLRAMKNANFLDLFAAQMVYNLDGDDIQAFCDYYNIYPTVITHGNWRMAIFNRKDTDERLTGDDYARMRAELDNLDDAETAKLVEHKEPEEIQLKHEEYGWLSPDGDYFPAPWGRHTSKAVEIAKERYNTNLDLSRPVHTAADFLCERGWVLLHSPSRGIPQVTTGERGERRLTKKQNEFLYDYYHERGLFEFADYYAKQL